MQRLAILPFDNLSSDTQLDWIGKGASAALANDLMIGRGIAVTEAASMREAYSSHATRFLHGYFYLRNGAFETHGTVEDANTHKSVQTLSATGPETGGILPLVNAMARQVSAGARPFSTSNASAFRAFGEALSATDASAQDRAFQAAIEADPNFSTAYVLWAESLLARGDRAGVEKVVSRGRADHPRSIENAKLNYLAAAVQGDAAAQIQALKSWANLESADPQTFRRLGDLEIARRSFTEAVRDYETAAKNDPEDTAIWNLLGYAQAFAGDLDGARRSLTEYRTGLPPGDVNALDSLGEVSFYLGDFRAAESNFLQAHEKNPAALGGVELLKAAQARLMTGELEAADAIFHRYADFRKRFPGALLDYQQAQWQFLTGRRKAAMARLQKSIPVLDPDTAAFALCQLSVWKLQTGDRAGAADEVRQAAAKAASPATRALSGTLSGSVLGSNAADPYALLFQRKYDRALPLLEAAYRETNPTVDGQVRTLLAWADVETGRMQDARRLLQLYPLPLAQADAVFASLIFPKFFYLKGAVLENAGNREEAKRNYRLYLKFAGDLDGIFGDEEKARKLLL